MERPSPGGIDVAFSEHPAVLKQVNRYRSIWTKLAQLLTETPQIAQRINALIEAGLWKSPTSIEPEFQTNTSKAQP
jgi:hypothetical protein